MSRKSLNDVIHGDRTTVRGYYAAKEPSWDDYEHARTFEGGHDWSKSGGSGSKKSKDKSLYSFGNTAPSCYESHPPLKLPGTDFVIYGGSCLHPKIKDADVYIGFDGAMQETAKSYPWNASEVKFEIQDMGTPKNAGEFKKLVAWTADQVKAGRKVHCGCIGGHGRTGMFLAGLCSTFGEKDAVTYVRANYCKKAVESTSQIDFLVKNFGVVKVEGAKVFSDYKSSKGKSVTVYNPVTGAGSRKAKSEGTQRFTPVEGNGCIW